MLDLGKIELGLKQVTKFANALVEQGRNVLTESHLKSKVSNFPGHVFFPFSKYFAEVIFDLQAFLGLHY